MTGTGTNRVHGLVPYTVAKTAAPGPGASDFLRPTADVSQSGIGLWTIVGDTDIYNCLDEVTANGTTDYTHYLSLGVDDPGTSFICELTDTMTPASGSLVKMRWNFRRVRSGSFGESTGGSPGDRAGDGPGGDATSSTSTPTLSGVESLVIDLIEGGTTIASSGNIANDSFGDWTPGSLVLTEAQIAAITVWDDLRVRVTAAVSGSYVLTTFDVTWFAIEIADEPVAPEGISALLLCLLPDKCYVAEIDADQVSPDEDTGATASTPQGVNFRGRTADTLAAWWYVVDGEASFRVLSNGTSLAPTVEDWKDECDDAFPSEQDVFPENCRLIERFRNRIWLASQGGNDPNDTIFYACAKGNPLDWRYGNDEDQPAELSAFAGTNAYLGGAPQPITCLAAWGDDFMLIGLSTGIMRVIGDIGEGGVIDFVTNETGVHGARSWCYDEMGNFWFWFKGSLYVLERGSNQPRNVSGRRLHRMMKRTDYDSLLVQLVYDGMEKSVRIFMTPPRTPQTYDTKWPCFQNGYAVSICYDILRDAFHPDDWPYDPMGPWSVCRCSPDGRFLIGGDDGYIRRPYDGGPVKPEVGVDPTYGTADDMPHNGTPTAPGSSGANYPITSEFTSAAIEAPMGDQELIVSELNAVGADNDGPLNIPLGEVGWTWLVSDSPDNVVNPTTANSVATGVFFVDGDYGYQPPRLLRNAGGAHAVHLRHSSAETAWSMSRLTARFRLGARRRT